VEIVGTDPDRARQIEVVPYDAAWPQMFAAQEAKIRAALGSAALLVEHVGSTSVPGLPAKPVIDVQLAVRDCADETAYRAALEQAGYRLVVREPEWFDHRLFKGADPQTNLHVFSAGCPELDRCRVFRDWLRVSPRDAQLYATTKQELAKREWAHVQDYADAKQGVIAEIMTRAEAWGRESGRSARTPGPASGAERSS
jgi:GrpB-like predicted nucleotidyltransferase (UPF0157 family)